MVAAGWGRCRLIVRPESRTFAYRLGAAPCGNASSGSTYLPGAAGKPDTLSPGMELRSASPGSLEGSAVSPKGYRICRRFTASLDSSQVNGNGSIDVSHERRSSSARYAGYYRGSTGMRQMLGTQIRTESHKILRAQRYVLGEKRIGGLTQLLTAYWICEHIRQCGDSACGWAVTPRGKRFRADFYCLSEIPRRVRRISRGSRNPESWTSATRRRLFRKRN